MDEEEWPDAGELDNFYLNDQNDVGYDTAEEEHIWIRPGNLAQPFDEDQLIKEFRGLLSGSKRDTSNTTFTRFLLTISTTSSCWSKRKIKKRR